MPLVSPDFLSLFFGGGGGVLVCGHLNFYQVDTQRPAYDICQYILEAKYGVLE